VVDDCDWVSVMVSPLARAAPFAAGVDERPRRHGP
jgi:hypothetical protein